jgi:hypothetical protein
MTGTPKQVPDDGPDNDTWPGHHVDAVLDALAALVEQVVDWSPSAWDVLAQVADTKKSQRRAVRQRANQTAAVHDRTRQLTFAHRTVANSVAHPGPAAAIRGLQDAITAMLLLDVLPHRDHDIITQPIRAATGQPHRQRRPSPTPRC